MAKSKSKQNEKYKSEKRLEANKKRIASKVEKDFLSHVTKVIKKVSEGSATDKMLKQYKTYQAKGLV